jgi:hypothetical protein
MPDHIHILTGPDDREASPPLPRFIQRFKSAATHRLWRLGISGVVWQSSYYDHVLRKDEDLERVARYILGNPVRKGLVDAAEAYPLSRSFSRNWPTYQGGSWSAAARTQGSAGGTRGASLQANRSKNS